MNITVTRADEQDVDSLVEFNLAMARETENKTLDRVRLRSGVCYAIDHPTEAIYLVARAGKSIAGALMITFEWSDWRAGRFWWIQSVYVRKEWRRQGIYRELHAAVRDLAGRDRQSCGIRLYVERENVNAKQAYRSLGMVETQYRLFEEEFVRSE